MEGEQPFSARLAKAVEDRRTSVQNDELPKLKELFRVFHSSYQGLHQLLIRKGLVQEDPYKGEQKISGITTPPDDPYLESERDLAVGIRLDAYDNILEFLNNYFEFRIDALGFKELKQLTDLVRYISWDQLTSHSSKPTTRGVADLVGRSRGGHDGFANSIISDSLDQLSRNSKAIAEQIQVIATFKREEYKLTLREQLLPQLEDTGTLKPDDPRSLETMRREHKALGLAGPFVPELASEVIVEENGPDAEQRRDEVLKRLKSTDAVKKRARPKESLRDVVVSAIRALAAASRSLEAVAENLQVNAEVARQHSGGFGERFKQWIDKLTNRKPAKVTYQIEYTDEQTGTRHAESVVLEEFVAAITKKSRLYGSFLARTGSPWQKIQKASEEQLYQFINKELGECHVIHRRAGALDAQLKAGAGADDRRKMKGVKIELTSVRNAIAASNQLKHEYVAKKEEHEQLKKLGVDL
jgi:hypothetical protein